MNDTATRPFERLTLRNVRCFRDATIELDPQVTVLLGENGSGKTTVVEALASLAAGEGEGSTAEEIAQPGFALEDNQDILICRSLGTGAPGSPRGRRRGMRKGIFGVVLALLGVADTALAATAEFQGFCTNSVVGGTLKTHCKFTVLRHPSGTPATSCGALGISSTSWDFGDGTTGSSPGTIEHDYTGVVSTIVNVTVYCVDGSTASAWHCFDNNIGFGGCIIPGAGWTPQ